MSRWEIRDVDRQHVRNAGRDDGGYHLRPSPQPTTDLLRFVLTAYRDGHPRPLVDRIVHATPEMFARAEPMGEDDAELTALWCSRGWDVTLEVFDPDFGPNSTPVVSVTLRGFG